MAFTASISAEPGRNIAVTVRKIDANGALGDYWNENSGAWEASAPTEANQRIALTEGSGQSAGAYHASKSSLGADSSAIRILYIDTDLNECIAEQTTYLSSGDEVELAETLSAAKDNIDAVLTDSAQLITWWSDGGTLESKLDTAAAGGQSLNISALTVEPTRTWRLYPQFDSNTAPNAVTIGALTGASKVTVAMDFSRSLNAGTDITSVDSVSSSPASGITIANLKPSQSGQQAHFDVSGVSASTTFDITVQVTTTDGQTLTGVGKLRVL